MKKRPRLPDRPNPKKYALTDSHDEPKVKNHKEVKAPVNIRSRLASDDLFRIEMALTRFDSGDYGYCISCEGQIAISDLEADPSAIVCEKCSRKPKPPLS